MRSLSCHPHGNGFIATTGRANGVVIFDVRSPGKPLMKMLHPGPHGPPDLHRVGRLYRDNPPTRNHDFSGVKWNRNGREIAALGHDGLGFLNFLLPYLCGSNLCGIRYATYHMRHIICVIRYEPQKVHI